MEKYRIKYYANSDCICFPQKIDPEALAGWRPLEAPFIIPLGWNFDENYRQFERELKELVSRYFDKEYISDFLER